MFPGRDVGVDVELRHGSLRCNLGVYNGERLKVTTLKPPSLHGAPHVEGVP